MAVIVSPPPPKTDFRFDDWMYLFWKMLRGSSGGTGIPPGGTTGQVLTKIDNTDYNVYWQNPYTPAITAHNSIQNSNFQVRDKPNQATVVFATVAPYSQHARRWYGIAPTADYQTEISSTNDMVRIAVHRTAGTDTGDVRLFQIFDTEDSLHLSNLLKLLVVSNTVAPGCNYQYIRMYLDVGFGVDESAADYLSGSWTGQTSLIATTAGQSYANFPSGVTQVAFELRVQFLPTASPSDDIVYFDFAILTDSGGTILVDDKSLAVVKKECDRYYQQMDLYLTTTYQNVPIAMRAVPVVTLGDAAAFDTTGTTQDTLMIKVNGAGDIGIHTVYLDCEL